MKITNCIKSKTPEIFGRPGSWQWQRAAASDRAREGSLLVDWGFESFGVLQCRGLNDWNRVLGYILLTTIIIRNARNPILTF